MSPGVANSKALTLSICDRGLDLLLRMTRSGHTVDGGTFREQLFTGADGQFRRAWRLNPFAGRTSPLAQCYRRSCLMMSSPVSAALFHHAVVPTLAPLRPDANHGRMPGPMCVECGGGPVGRQRYVPDSWGCRVASHRPRAEMGRPTSGAGAFAARCVEAEEMVEVALVTRRPGTYEPRSCWRPGHLRYRG
jgi:hypothetical protein